MYAGTSAPPITVTLVEVSPIFFIWYIEPKKNKYLINETTETAKTIALLTKAVTPLQQVYNRHRR